MQKTILQIHDEVNCTFKNLPANIRNSLHIKSKVFNPSNRYIPSVRLGRWDGCEYYFSISGKTYINLLSPIIDYLTEQKFEIELEDLRPYNRNFEFDRIDNEYLSNISWPKKHMMANDPIILRDHQVEAANIFLENQQGIASLPTGSGKSLLAALLSKKVEKYGRSIVIVPNKDLITQTEEYYNVDKKRIYLGGISMGGNATYWFINHFHMNISNFT